MSLAKKVKGFSPERRVCVLSGANTNPLLAMIYETPFGDKTSPIRKEDDKMAEAKTIVKTVRLTQDEDEMIRQLASEFGMSGSQVMRYAMNSHMADYFSTVRYVDDQTARDIRTCIAKVGDELQQVRNELHRIGVNYNQAVRMVNIENKNGTVSVAKEIPLLDKAELDRLINRFAECEKEVSETLWLIHQ